MVASIVEELTITPRPVFVDEADYLLRDRGVMLDVLRDIYDLAKIPVILIGMESFAHDLQRFGQGRFRRRISQWVEFKGLDEADSATLIRTLCEVEVSDDLCAFVHQDRQANVGQMVIAISRIEAFAKQNGLGRITKEDWGRKSLMLSVGPGGRK